nr:hypothetical protein [Tanacetum cinerariifolium]
SWNSSDDKDVDEQTKGREESEGDKTDESDDGSNDGNDDDNEETVKASSDKDDDDNDDEEELAKNDDEDTESGKGGDEVSESEGSNEKDQELRLSEEARIQEEEEAYELYHDVNINQGRGLQVTQNIEDSHVTLTLVHPHGPQESSSVSSFVTSMLNPISDAGERLRSLETSFSEYKQTNQFANAVSVIPDIVHQYMDQQMKEA